MVKVFITGGESIGWALDEDLRLLQESLNGIVTLTKLEDAEVVHSVWWEAVLDLPEPLLDGKRIVCHTSNDPAHYVKHPSFARVRDRVGQWVTRSSQASRVLRGLGIESRTVTYSVDTSVFKPFRGPEVARELADVRNRLGIPQNAYVIGNFHRDSEGANLKAPKRQKAPEVLAAICESLWSMGNPIHVLLAGPRRHWLRNQLRASGVPFSFVGELTHDDDIGVNILPRSNLAILYAISSLHLLCSRWEGGPHSIMEAAACGIKIVSPRVGLAEDILEPASLFEDPTHAVEMIADDIASNALQSTVEPQLRRIHENHQTPALARGFKQIYDDIGSIPVFRASSPPRHPILRGKRPIVVSIWHEFMKPPYGGGNQFLIALSKALLKKGVQVVQNEISNTVDVYLLNAVHFDVDKFKALKKESAIRVLHRIDGPISLYRGRGPELDHLCFELNREYATATVIQSRWTFDRLVEMGFTPVRPTLVHNAADGDIFHSRGRSSYQPGRKMRLISSSWSDNPRKGLEYYRWLDEHLDFNRFDYTFVGRINSSFKNIRFVHAVPSEQLGDLLREHDVYITASENDPCSNALIEALACGLPALYLRSGGHQELVGFGGLGFSSQENILLQLDRLVSHYQLLQRGIVVPTIEEVAEKYLEIIETLC